ncbi:LysR family transcriptional regulator [Nesterenkonia lutea]|uniref:DNA-binding transcriptional LysR family regulator n=1 Tax=Nesterenkonia lutea TaxID=272919 RepID=A0ABR9JGR0_9MICC|nr:LysR family transcriptional regulator [Nesterenkonia lutea]MBE1525119.1 DNA-binding transcriptional LysR family regulator [Nesterenkonia lutea]
MASYTLRQLESFVAVAENGSIAGAAEALRVSQSSIAGALNNLERVFDAQLTIRRKAHGVTLTPNGRFVLERAKNLLNQAEDLELHADAAGTELRGSLKLGCYLTLAPTVLSRLMDHYGRRYPGVELDFFDGAQTEVHRRLASGELDAAIAYDMALPSGLSRRRLYHAEPTIVLAADHPLAPRAELSLADVAAEPMILLDVDPSRENTTTMFEAAGLEPNIRFRTTDYEVTRSLVGRGMGYAILVQQPAGDQSYEGRRLAVRPISPSVRHVPVSIVWPESVRLSQATTALIDLASELYPAKPKA